LDFPDLLLCVVDKVAEEAPAAKADWASGPNRGTRGSQDRLG
jgi:hypothetical protein